MLSLKNIGQRLLDSTTLDEKVGNFFRPKTGTLASTGRKWAQELAARPLTQNQQRVAEVPIGAMRGVTSALTGFTGLENKIAPKLGLGTFTRIKPQYAPGKIAEVAGAIGGSLIPAAPINQLAKLIKPVGAVRTAQKYLGNRAGKLIAQKGLTGLGGRALANVSQGIPFTAGFALAQKIGGQQYGGKQLAGDVGFDAAAGALIPGAAAAIPLLAGITKNKADLSKVLKNEAGVMALVKRMSVLDKMGTAGYQQTKAMVQKAVDVLAPDLAKNRELSKLKDGINADQWMKTVTNVLQDRLVAAKTGDYTLAGMSTRAMGKLDTPKLSVEPTKPTAKPRGLTTSVQEAPNINPTVKGMVDNSYTPKTNPELMGEARAMLSELPEGSKIDFKGVKNVDQKVAATIQEAINLQNAGDYKAAANLYNNLSEQGTELGRGVQAFSLLQKMTPEAISYSIASKIKKFNSLGKQQIPELNGEQTKLIADQVKVIDSLTGREKNIAINELEKTLNSFIPSSMLDKVSAVWKAGLLTSLRTHERNLIGNTIHGTMEVAKDYLASPVDALLGMKTGKRTLTATTQGLGSGVNRETGQQMVDMVKLGYDPSEQINKFDYKQITWADTPMQQFFKKYTDVVFRTLGASDKPFYNSALAHSLWNQAGAEAINAGQKGNKAFIENLVKNPTEEMMKTAISDANIATFKDKNAISGVANAIKNALSKNEWSKFGGEIVMPFTGVPSSVFSQIKNYSPIGLAQGIIKAGRVLAGQVPELQRQAAQEIGRGVIGTGIYGLGAYLMSKGLMTGQPEDAEEQRLWDLQNKPRNSVMVNGKWRSLNSLGPETFILLAGGKLQEEMSQKDGSISNYAGTLGKDVLDQSFVQGINAPVNAITDPKRYAKSYVGNLISSTVPNVVKDSSKAFDSKQRETNSIMDYTKLGIPGLRNTLVEKRDSLGNVMKQEPTGFSAFVDVFNSKTPVKNQVTDELSRLQQAGAGYVPSKLTKNQTIAGIKKDLTPQELNQLEAKVGPELTAKMTALINSSGYQKLSDEDKATALQSITTSTRKIARAGGISGVTTTPTESTGKVYTLVNQETGSVKEVDLSKPIEVPEMTGNTELDKKLKSGYKSDITSRINDIVKLYEDGQLDAKTAEAQIIDLKTQSSKLAGGKKPKKITIKTTKAPRVSFKLAKPTKMSVIKAPTSKRARISFKNYKPAKIKV